MEKPTITPQDISSYYSLASEFRDTNEKANAAIIAARENSQNVLTIARNGKAMELPEGALWDEVWGLGLDCEAATILSEKYPEALKLWRESEAKRDDMKRFAITKWGIDPLAMSLSDILRLMEAMIEYKLGQKV